MQVCEALVQLDCGVAPAGERQTVGGRCVRCALLQLLNYNGFSHLHR
jgi:hypothetical protein